MRGGLDDSDESGKHGGPDARVEAASHRCAYLSAPFVQSYQVYPWSSKVESEWSGANDEFDALIGIGDSIYEFDASGDPGGVDEPGELDGASRRPRGWLTELYLEKE